MSDEDALIGMGDRSSKYESIPSIKKGRVFWIFFFYVVINKQKKNNQGNKFQKYTFDRKGKGYTSIIGKLQSEKIRNNRYIRAYIHHMFKKILRYHIESYEQDDE
jgi:hypothetical protein